jgi:hypothetical protein
MESSLVREHPMSVNWLEVERPRQVHVPLSQENARLIEENRQLRMLCADLVASSELWIRLYEAALAREGDRLQKHG